MGGKGEGLGLKVYEGGAVYIGEFKNGEEDGVGELNFAEGTKRRRMAGIFRDGELKDGFGELNYRDGRTYIGDVKDGEPFGIGVTRWDNGIIFIGKYDEEKAQAIKIFPDGVVRAAKFTDGKAGGKGTKIFNDGRQYAGSFKNDLFSGPGVLTWPNWSKKDRYVGSFKKGEMETNEEEYESADLYY